MGSLVPVGDVIVRDQTTSAPRGATGLAWCPTASARARFHALGVSIEAPEPEIVRRVNHRRWAAERGLSLPHAAWFTEAGALLRHLADHWGAMGWLIRRPFGFAGRGRLTLRDGDELGLPRVRGWIEGALRDDGLLVEPLVLRIEDFGLHGWLSRDGELHRGALTRQRCDAAGVWRSSERWERSGLSASERDALEDAFDDSARGLREAGYFGAFGVDAFTWSDGGERRIQPRCEVNARYSMGWAIGMGALRPDLALRVR